MRSNREWLFWASGIMFGCGWMLPATQKPGFFIFPMILSVILLVIAMRTGEDPMKEIKDTTKEPHPEWLMGGNPGAIERQEKEGQMELVQSDQLPAKLNHPRGAYSFKEYEKMGIQMLGECEDKLFWKVKLPEGWRIRATEHPMWSELIDDTGKKRASIFYKAAFYDRDAFVNIEE